MKANVARICTSTYGDIFSRLGGTGTKSQLEWLVQFSRQDLGRMGPEERLRIREEVSLFCAISYAGTNVISQYPRAQIRKVVLPLWSLVRQLQAAVQKLLQQLIRHELVHLPEVTIRHSFLRIEPFSISAPLPPVQTAPAIPWAPPQEEVFNSKGQYIGPTFIHQKGMDEEAAFWNHVATLLNDAGDLLITCLGGDCGKLFVKTDKRKMFCSPTCKARHGMRTLRKKRKGISSP